jgi:hypothetical protein
MAEITMITGIWGFCAALVPGGSARAAFAASHVIFASGALQHVALSVPTVLPATADVPVSHVIVAFWPPHFVLSFSQHLELMHIMADPEHFKEALAAFFLLPSVHVASAQVLTATQHAALSVPALFLSAT